MPSSAVGSAGNDKGAVYCFLFIPPSVSWAAGLSRWGYPPPLNPGHPPERAGESTRTPLISPEKLSLLRPARGARRHLAFESEFVKEKERSQIRRNEAHNRNQDIRVSVQDD